jgi:CMP/dCMP kinase
VEYDHGLQASKSSKGALPMTNRPKIVAVDGPAGSGKSSICRAVAARIGWTYITSGAIYRAVGLLALDRGVSLESDDDVTAMVADVAPKLRWDAPTGELWYGSTNLGARLHSEEAGYAASKVAKLARVRAALLPLQRQITLAAPVGALLDGRDIGTVVFPDADLKIFLTASLEERSRRRLNQLGNQAATGGEAPASGIETIMEGLAKRDRRDASRESAPLKQAPDAVMLDTSHLDFAASVAALIELLVSRGLVPCG